MASNQGKSKQGGSSQQPAEAGRRGGSKQSGSGSGSRSGGSGGGTRGGTPEQHAEAGRQSHKNDKNR